MLFAKRGKGKIKADFGIREAYLVYKEDGGMLNYKLYGKLVRELNTQIGNKIILEALEFNMPAMIGSIRIRKFKLRTTNVAGESRFKKLRPNWVETKKLWAKMYPGKTLEELKSVENKPLVRHLNEHTNGYAYEFYYDRRPGKYRNKTVYSFLPSRSIKNALSAAALDKETKIDYYE